MDASLPVSVSSFSSCSLSLRHARPVAITRLHLQSTGEVFKGETLTEAGRGEGAVK